ncbi:farnesol dehydrogenase-like [Musca vetustissima]|uniref:farnesol dehydrogenase-like n=1 Tax=Musca vetustissima TaxID=27455 RepID=UPI002AB7707E|nr:farnesol dehydrogenase-like [Musca vetustissima]
MDRWQNKVAVVTGASSGIGAAICKTLVENGMIVVGLARRLVKINTNVKNALPVDKQPNFHAFKCDVSDEQNVKETFAWIEDKFGGVDVLINNAGVMKNIPLLAKHNSDDIKATLNTNVLGVVWCTREAFRSMRQRNDGMGHVFIINSTAGHSVPTFPGINFNIYPSSKHAVTAMTEVLRQEFRNEKTKIKITSLSPGGVQTEILNVGEVPQGIPILQPADVADAVLFCLKTPPHVQIHELTIKPVGELM